MTTLDSPIEIFKSPTEKLNITQEDIEPLLKDLCSRLPYGVKVKDRNGVHTLTPGNTEFVDLFNGKCNIKPYLFPLSSMTEEQSKELEEIDPEFYSLISENGNIYISMDLRGYDWLNKNHFDYRGLIEKGLAIDATGLNNVNK